MNDKNSLTPSALFFHHSYHYIISIILRLLVQKTLQVSCSFFNVYEKIVKKRDYFTAKLFLTGIAGGRRITCTSFTKRVEIKQPGFKIPLLNH